MPTATQFRAVPFRSDLNQAGTPIKLAPSQQLTDLNVALTPQAVITGKVIDADGDPISGGSVQVRSESSWYSHQIGSESAVNRPQRSFDTSGCHYGQSD